MGPQYQERFEVLTGEKQEIKKEKKRTQWKDEDLMEKIQLVNNWKNTNWFQPNKTYNPDMKKREILKPLVLSKEGITKDNLHEGTILLQKRMQELKDYAEGKK